MRLLCLLAVSLLAGCASPAPVSSVYPPTDPDDVDTSWTPTTGAVMLGRVSGHACSEKYIDRRDPSKTAARRALKEEAAKLGATGIHRVTYVDLGTFGPCRGKQGVEATGIAYRDAD
ncbi:hypothetical protein [Aquibium oceanicum]|uniref:Uncharacterized protein n=1 Tax=Aquibium oceanicum TaxID=1670800 RepID=A0A1L3SU34_9HYPH|nr:hypothetical protein [Aquibium oceanicum]APH72916.1 hypothetical protein BSQ44_17235 [Aquibium oceanicum]